MKKATREDLDHMQASARAMRRADGWIKVGLGTSGVAAGADRILRLAEEEIAKRGLDVQVRRAGGIGMDYAEPLVEIHAAGPPRTMYGQVDEAALLRLIEEHIVGRRVVEEMVVPGVAELGYEEDPALGPQGKQRRVVLRNCGIIDPTSLDDYLARGGYMALRRALFDLGPEGTIDEIRRSGLRGRGGAGFPTGLKWATTRAAKGAEKFVICNGDEGDPGAYMDRSVLEGDPHSVIEGMLIAGFAIGATSGYFYIRAEYPLAVERIEVALRQAHRLGLVGKDILGSGYSLDLEVRLGAGAFVCGEETALIASVEGLRGTPRPRPPYPSIKGLWGMPTCINNVETLANIAPIVTRGAEWFAAMGLGKSTGTKVFALTGKVRRTGLVEIPMGTTIREIVEEIGGGALPGRRLKAVQTGGPSGGVIPEKHFDAPVTYESLQELGSIMGSGGMIVMDDSDSMFEIARFYMGFSVDESCGKCAPCRVGTRQMQLLLDKIAAGEGTRSDLDALHRVGHAMRKASLCGLGQSAPNPVLSTLRYYGEEYDRLLRPEAATHVASNADVA